MATSILLRRRPTSLLRRLLICQSPSFGHVNKFIFLVIMEAQKYIWEGSIPLQIHLHESEVTTLPAPPPALILGQRIGYLPLLVPLIKPHFSYTLPPGTDAVWFDYNGLPLKWYIPTGVLFDLLCAEPERPWNLTVCSC